MDSIDRRVEALYGPDAPTQLRAFRGLVHVTSVWAGDPRWPVILIRDHTPRSATDRFALALARARADAIVLTGKILRDEPNLRYPELSPALASWRREALGKSAPPWLLILSRRADFAPDHPVFTSAARPFVFTSTSRAQALHRLGRLGSRVELAAAEQPSLRAAIEHLRARGCATISLEAGPTTLASCYVDDASAPQIDELMLSRYFGPLSADLRGPPVVDPAWLARHYGRLGSARPRDASGEWEVGRWCRASPHSSLQHGL